ncbi:ribonuclease HI family protein [Candidatus Woesebacteria bacterium]|nr:MAG: ribonuclease HI family protein [Candidatus Woesebacteria bacterium]
METIEIFGDGGSRGNPGPAASAFVVLKNGIEIYNQSKYLGETTNNVAEYNSVLMALEWIKADRKEIINSEKIYFKLDSELITKQILGIYKIKSEHLITLHQKVITLLQDIDKEIVFSSVPRLLNKTADSLVNRELDKHKHLS